MGRSSAHLGLRRLPNRQCLVFRITFELETGGPDLLRSRLSGAILVQRSSRCLAVVSAMAMPKASATAEVASATAERRFTAEMILEHAERSPAQPWSRSNEALKHLRDGMEIFLQPRAFEQNLDLDPATLQICKCIHDRGAEFHFSRGDDTVPFSWSQMLLATGQSFDEVVGVGVVAVKVFARPYSYDHKRAAAYGLQHGGQHLVFPPIWDFLVVRADGTGVLLHPRWRRNSGIEILPFAQCPPRRGAYSIRAKAMPPLPGISSDTDFSQPSSPSCLRCFSGCPRRCRSRRRHLRLRGRAMHIAAHRRAFTTRFCRGFRLRYLRLRGML